MPGGPQVLGPLEEPARQDRLSMVVEAPGPAPAPPGEEALGDADAATLRALWEEGTCAGGPGPAAAYRSLVPAVLLSLPPRVLRAVCALARLLSPPWRTLSRPAPLPAAPHPAASALTRQAQVALAAVPLLEPAAPAEPPAAAATAAAAAAARAPATGAAAGQAAPAAGGSTAAAGRGGIVHDPAAQEVPACATR
jgi:hypothetical protein